MNEIVKYSAISTRVLSRAERFWQDVDVSTDTHEMLRFSFYMGVFPFAGYLFSYTVVGQIWNRWPLINTTLPVLRGLMCAGLQWIFFSIFPSLSTLLLELVFPGFRKNSERLTVVSTYSMVPMFISALFAGVPFVNITAMVLGIAAFLYFLFFGYRDYLKLSLWRCILMALLTFSLFGLIRQMFVFVIGF